METILLQITSGKGPAECCWVVAQILKYLIEEAKKAGIEYEIMHRQTGNENGSLYSATIQLTGKSIENFSKQWTGTIQWIGHSQFRKHHKRKNWFVAVNKIDLSDSSIVVNDKDIYYQPIRSGGPGGQHVNKVSTAIRAKHLPSGLSVLVSESRSQLQNKKLAKSRLLSLLKIEQLNQQKDRLQNEWMNHLEIQRGNPIKTFTGSDFKIQKNVNNYKQTRRSLKHKLRLELLE